MGKLITAALAIVAFLALVPTAEARTKAIDGACGMHLIRPVIPTNNWHVRIGPKSPGGRYRCHGYYLRKRSSTQAGLPGIGSWVPFGCQVCADVYGWKWKGILYTGVDAVKTSMSCYGFGKLLVSKLVFTIYGGLSAAAAGDGCISGWHHIYQRMEGVNHVFTIRGFHGS